MDELKSVLWRWNLCGGANYCYSIVNKKCAIRNDPGLTTSWITQTQTQGWSYMPLWVGSPADDFSEFIGDYFFVITTLVFRIRLCAELGLAGQVKTPVVMVSVALCG